MNNEVFANSSHVVWGVGNRMQWFTLPEKRMVSHSVRFGDHECFLNKETIQIMPVKDNVRTDFGSVRAKHSLGIQACVLSGMQRFLQSWNELYKHVCQLKPEPLPRLLRISWDKFFIHLQAWKIRPQWRS